MMNQIVSVDKLSSRVSDKYINRKVLCITEEDMYKKLCKLEVDKSPGLDMMHPRVGKWGMSGG